MRALISGAMGRMGQQCIRVFTEEKIELPILVDPRAETSDGRLFAHFSEVPAELFCDVAVDFSSPAALDALLYFCRARKIGAVLATTGFSTGQLDTIAEAAKEIPIFLSRNMSIGVNILGRLCELLARALAPDCDIEIVETHHAAKADAPSGTALYLADMVKRGNGGGSFVYDRRVSERRKPGEIGIHSLRGGSVVGRHEVCFFTKGESLYLSHAAEDRELFARGALAAARFLTAKESGLFGMDDLVEEIFKSAKIL